MAPKRPPPPAETELMRVAWLNFAGRTRDEAFNLGVGGCNVSQQHVNKWEDGKRKRTSILVVAHTELTYFPSVCDGRIVVPRRERTMLEFAIETTANMRAVFENVPYAISSPWECVYFRPRSDVARQWFSEFSEIHDEHHQQHGRSLANWSTLDYENLDPHDLADRIGGVALLSEVLHTKHPMGVYRDLVRLFELAFAVGPKRLAPLVTATVDPSMNYTLDEVHRWFDARDGASHADQRKHFLLSTDVEDFIARMRQAAYDVLFNKKEWHTPNTDRRAFWTFPTSAGPGSDLNITKGRDATISMQVLDFFNVWPHDMTGRGHVRIEDVWPSPPENGTRSRIASVPDDA